VIVNNLDAPGEGFNDPAPCVPVGSNSATTVGQARLIAFQFAASLWGQSLQSTVPIRVDAHFDPLTCTATTGVLGLAGTTSAHRDFPNAPRASTWYPQALANARAGVDLDPATAEITANFNSNLGSSNCLSGTAWYYGLDSAAPSNAIDLVTIVLHELGHGLGFQAFVNLTTGARFMDADDAFMVNLERHGTVPANYPAMTDAQRVAASTSDPNLHWLGARTNTLGEQFLSQGMASGHVRMYGPSVVIPGSSVSHFSVQLSPNDLLEPNYTKPTHDLSLTLGAMQDIGWTITPPAPVPALPERSAPAFALLMLTFALGLIRSQGHRDLVVVERR